MWLLFFPFVLLLFRFFFRCFFVCFFAWIPRVFLHFQRSRSSGHLQKKKRGKKCEKESEEKAKQKQKKATAQNFISALVCFAFSKWSFAFSCCFFLLFQKVVCFLLALVFLFLIYFPFLRSRLKAPQLDPRSPPISSSSKSVGVL